MPLTLGVIAVQGDVSEHLEALERAMDARGVEGEAVPVRRPDELAAVDGVVLPGGESTTISKLLVELGLADVLRERARHEDLPVMGTCAGMILLAREGDDQVEATDTELLGLMDLATDRNAFGRQRESFEAPVHLEDLDAPFQAVFIRAPAATRTWGDCQAIARLPADAVARATGGTAPPGDRIVAARQGNRLALAFHPELTPDDRLHARFVELVRAWKDARAADAVDQP